MAHTPTTDTLSGRRPRARPVLVALPGTGSDAPFAARSLGPVAAEFGAELVAVEPRPGHLVAGYREELDAAAARGPVIAAGISLGAAVALAWALDRATTPAADADTVRGVVACLPAWSGPAVDAPAALAARATATAVRDRGLEPTVAAMRAGSPPWLADELTRSWRRLGTGLVPLLEEAAATTSPAEADLAALWTPLAVVVAEDDPVHPAAVGRAWAAAAPRAHLESVRLAEIGADPGVLGRRGADALRTALTGGDRS